MATRLGPSIITLTICLSLAATPPGRAQGPAFGADEVKNTFGLCRVQLRNLSAAVRARLDDEVAGAAQVEGMKRRMSDQQWVIGRTEGEYDKAKLKTEVAEIMVTVYEAGTFKQTLETIERDIAMANAEVKRAENRFEEARNHVEETKALVERIGQMPKEHIGELMSEYYAGQNRKAAENQVQSAKSSIDKAKISIEQAETSKKVLLEYIKEKTIKELKAKVEEARADALMKRAELELARVTKNRMEFDRLLEGEAQGSPPRRPHPRREGGERQVRRAGEALEGDPRPSRRDREGRPGEA